MWLSPDSWEGCCLATVLVPGWAGLALYYGWKRLEQSRMFQRPGFGGMVRHVSARSFGGLGWFLAMDGWLELTIGSFKDFLRHRHECLLPGSYAGSSQTEARST